MNICKAKFLTRSSETIDLFLLLTFDKRDAKNLGRDGLKYG